MSDGELEMKRAALKWTDDELREIAHRLSHYRTSHGDLPVEKLVPYTCDELKETVEIGYRHLENALSELLKLRASPPLAPVLECPTNHTTASGEYWGEVEWFICVGGEDYEKWTNIDGSPVYKFCPDCGISLASSIQRLLDET